MIYRFIEVQKATYPITLLCRSMGVSRSAFHDWAARGPTSADLDEAYLTNAIVDIHRDSRGTLSGQPGQLQTIRRTGPGVRPATYDGPRRCSSNQTSAVSADHVLRRTSHTLLGNGPISLVSPVRPSTVASW
jgi:hypothetical protein